MSGPLPPEKTKLYKSRRDRKLAGVCGGLAEFFGIDSGLVRLIWILIVLAGGSGLLLYAVLALVLDNNPYE